MAWLKMYAGGWIGEVDGVRLIKPETVEKARTLRTGAMVPPGDFGKLVFGCSTQYGLGYEFAVALKNKFAGPGAGRLGRRTAPAAGWVSPYPEVFGSLAVGQQVANGHARPSRSGLGPQAAGRHRHLDNLRP